MVVVDTNILAYLLIAGDRTRETQALYGRDSDWKSEAYLLVEFSNILATYQRWGELDPNQVEGLMNDAETRISGPTHVAHIIARRTAQISDIRLRCPRWVYAGRSQVPNGGWSREHRVYA